MSLISVPDMWILQLPSPHQLELRTDRPSVTLKLGAYHNTTFKIFFFLCASPSNSEKAKGSNFGKVEPADYCKMGRLVVKCVN